MEQPEGRMNYYILGVKGLNSANKLEWIMIEVIVTCELWSLKKVFLSNIFYDKCQMVFLSVIS